MFSELLLEPYLQSLPDLANPPTKDYLTSNPNPNPDPNPNLNPNPNPNPNRNRNPESKVSLVFR